MRSSVGFVVTVAFVVAVAVAFLVVLNRKPEKVSAGQGQSNVPGAPVSGDLPGAKPGADAAVRQESPFSATPGGLPLPGGRAKSRAPAAKAGGRVAEKQDVPEAALIYLEPPQQDESRQGETLRPPASFPTRSDRSSPLSRDSRQGGGQSAPGRSSIVSLPVSPGQDSSGSEPTGTDSSAGVQESADQQAPAVNQPADQEPPVENRGQVENHDQAGNSEHPRAKTLAELSEEKGEHFDFELIRRVHSTREKNDPDSLALALFAVPLMGSEEAVPWLKEELLQNSVKVDPSLRYAMAIIDTLDRMDQPEGLSAISRFADMLEKDPACSDACRDMIDEARFLALSNDAEKKLSE